MVDQNALKAIIEQVLTEMNIGNAAAAASPSAAEAVKAGETPAAPAAEGVVKVDDGFIPDVSEIDIRKQYLVENPVNGEAYYDLKQYAPARLGIGKAGARYKTLPVLEFRAAHSAAQDAVFSQMDLEFVEKLDLFVVRTMCTSKDEYLTRPDLGRKLNPEGVAMIKEKCKKNPTVQIFVSDGLSSELLHISKESNVGCRVYEDRIPIDYQTAAMAEQFNMNLITAALNGGEDYELLFTVPLADHDKVSEMKGIKVIGHITKPELGNYLVGRDGGEVELKAQGWNSLN